MRSPSLRPFILGCVIGGCNASYATKKDGREYQQSGMDEDVQELLEKRRYRQAFERLLELYEVRIFRMALMFVKDAGHAEEVAQEIFLRLWQALPSYDGRAAPSTWLYTIARNTCLSAIRSAAYRKTDSLETIEEPAATGDSDVLAGIELKRCLQRLPPVQKDVITLFYLQERSVVEVARMLDMPEGTVKSHLHRARLALADIIRR